MKIIRSTKCSLKFTNQSKINRLKMVMGEYGNVVNFFINQFWTSPPHKFELLKNVVNLSDSWLSARLRKAAAQEAINMIKVSVGRDGEKDKKPIHKGKKMSVSSTIASLRLAKKAKEFDAWLHLYSIGDKIIFDIPIRFHKHFNELNESGKRLESYIITDKYIQFCFEIETGPKKTRGNCVGVDTGINALASTSEGKQYGADIKNCIERIKRCDHGSNGQKRARRALRQRMDEVAKEVVTDDVCLIVDEKLKNINKNTKKNHKLHKHMRKTIGSWAYHYWLGRLRQATETARCSFRSVSPYYTSQKCPICSYINRRNRSGEDFRCQNCNYAGNADIIAAQNILDRSLFGPYGAEFKIQNGINFH